MLGLGHRRSGHVGGDDVVSHGGELADLVSTWSEVVDSHGWVSPGDWWHPAVEPAAAAVLTGGDPCPALARLGGARAQAGVTVTEALDDIEALYRAFGHAEPPYEAVRCYVEAYSDALLGAVTQDACEDPLTGMTTREYLRTRLAEDYREADRQGTTVADTSALVVVDMPVEGRGRLFAAIGMIEVADVLRQVFSGGETCSAVTPWRGVALVKRRAELPRAVQLVQEMLSERGARIGPTRSWIEGLPVHESAADDLLAELSR